ncbi:hypothetical protein, partial [Pseudomarimonas arenosa]|uniref:hypothetical protein n=1 Tax=Pseudomarimonas arenosa TaxID=2774145 RepID=UPI001CDD72AA
RLLRSNGYFVACAFATLGRLLRSNGYFVACAFAMLGRLLRSYAGLRPDLAQVGPHHLGSSRLALDAKSSVIIRAPA